MKPIRGNEWLSKLRGGSTVSQTKLAQRPNSLPPRTLSTQQGLRPLLPGARPPLSAPYRPQAPQSMQRKSVPGRAPNMTQARMQRPVAPPVYRAQPTPKVLQLKVRAGDTSQPQFKAINRTARASGAVSVRPEQTPRSLCRPQAPSVQRCAVSRINPSSRTVIQRAERCPWCNDLACVNGSICKSSSSNIGIYGGRVQDQRHLSTNYGQKVSGSTHQMEHPFGYNVLAGPLHVSGARASTPDTRLIERTAPAYHEEYSPHRGHEGTGNVNEPRESGLNSDQYRHDQRVALEDQNLDIAMALNQMTYGHQNLPRDRIGLEQSNDSYGRMVRNMGSVPLWTSGGVVQIP